MGKIAAFVMISLDGYYDGTEAWALDWHNVDAEFNEFAIAQLDDVDCLIFGRATYQGMAQYWPTEAGIRDDPEVASRMNNARKIVVSRSLERPEPEWSNTRLVSTELSAEFSKLKRESRRDSIVMGSGRLIVSLMDAGLLDELRIMVNPVVLGSGKSLFAGGKRTSLALRSDRRFRSGNVLLTYEPVRD